jgi:hypothetical protein
VGDNTAVGVLLFTALALFSGQPEPSLDVFRIFLNDGRVLSSYGEPAQVEDDLVFVISQGIKGGVEAHDLITVPIAKVNMERTLEYANALRSTRYGATRGEQEYREFTNDIARMMTELEASNDKDRRIGIAQVARNRILAWAPAHFGYRANDLSQLASLVDEVIVELQAASGTSQFALDFVANVAPQPGVRLWQAPTAVDSVVTALMAASATEVGVEKIALLKSASRVVDSLPDAYPGLKAEVARALAAELAVDNAYRTLYRSVLTRADVAVRQGRPAAVTKALQDLAAADEKLGRRRPVETAATARRLESELALAMQQRALLDGWAQVRGRFRAYETRVRSLLEGWGTQEVALAGIREGRRVGPAALDAALRRFSELDRGLTTLRPPDELLEVHGVFRSAVMMAKQALLIGQRLSVAANRELADHASAAVAGAELLRSRGFDDLAAALKPRRVR